MTVPYYLTVHNYTETLDRTFLMDSLNRQGRLPNPVEVPIFPLLIRACEALDRPGRHNTTATNTIRDEVQELVDMYSRKIVPDAHQREDNDTEAVHAELRDLTPVLPRRLPQEPSEGYSDDEDDEVEEQDPNSVGDDAMQLNDLGRPDSSIETPTDGSDGGKLAIEPMVGDLGGYEDEPAATPAVLSSRTRWHCEPLKPGHPHLGLMLYATSSDFVTCPTDTVATPSPTPRPSGVAL